MGGGAGGAESPVDAGVQLFGNFALWVGDSVLGAGEMRPSALALLVLLALQPRHALHREQVADALWPDASPQRVYNNLYKALQELRRPFAGETAGRAFVRMQRCVLSLAPWVRVDVDEFRGAVADARRTGDRAARERARRFCHAGLAVPPVVARRLPARVAELETWVTEVCADFDETVRAAEVRGRADSVEVEPQLVPVRFARTGDGCRIAYRVTGTGPPLVEMPIYPFSDLRLESQIPAWHEWHRALADGRTLVRYDGRGSGMSERAVSELPVAALVSDLGAVVDALQLRTFDLFASLQSGLGALAFAAAHPGKVRRLVLWAPCAAGKDDAPLPLARFARAATATDWRWSCQVLAREALQWRDGAVPNAAARFLIAASCPETLRVVMRDLASATVGDGLADVDVPVLVLRRRQAALPARAAVDRVVGSLVHAELREVPGDGILPFSDHSRDVVALVHDFIGDDGARAAVASGP